MITLDIEFKHTLRNGREIFILAVVGDSVEIVAALTSDDPDAVEVPLESLSEEDQSDIEFWAAQEFLAAAHLAKEAI